MKTVAVRHRVRCVVESSVQELPTVQLEDVEGRCARLIGDLEKHPPAGQNRFSPGDVLFSKLRPYLAKSLLVDCELQGSSEFLCLRPVAEMDSRYLTFLTLSSAWLKHAAMASYGSKMPRTSWDHMATFQAPNLKIDEQRRIADFLDDRVARIDRIIVARRGQRDMAHDMPWINVGARLASFPGVPLRRGIARLSDGPFGSAFASSDYVDCGPAVIRLGNIGFGEFRDEDLARIPGEIYERFPNAHVRPGNLLIASLGDAKNHAGRACIAPDDLGLAMVKGKCFVSAANPAVATERFLSVLLSSPLGAQALVQQGTGATRSMLNFDRLLSCRLPIPNMSEQDRLVREFDAEREAIARSEAALTISIDLLAEYKQSLITAAVTGQMDVTTAGSGVPG